MRKGRSAAIAALVAGLVGSWGFTATAADGGHPFDAILVRLDLILAAIQDATDLRGVKQNWDKKLNSENGDANGCNSDRFTCVFDGDAVRDNETGLVWERQPGSSLFPWEEAIRQCWLRSGQGVGGHQTSGRMGWRLPTIEQLASLVDSAQMPPSLPVGHPFKDAFGEDSSVSPVYWSATTDTRAAFFPSQAWELRIANGTVGDAHKTGARRIWCVRGGSTAVSSQ